MTCRFFAPFLFAVVALSLGCSSSESDAASPTEQDTGVAEQDSGGGTEDVQPATDTSAADTTGDSGADTSVDAASSDACAPLAPNLEGTEACKALPFGVAAVDFVAVDPAGPTAMGGTLPAGIYDIVKAERGTTKGSWRETFVVDGKGKFTRIRQIDTGSGSGVGPITYVSGSYKTTGTNITLTTECVMGGTGKPGDETTLPYGVVSGACKTDFFFTATGIRVTLRQR